MKNMKVDWVDDFDESYLMIIATHKYIVTIWKEMGAKSTKWLTMSAITDKDFKMQNTRQEAKEVVEVELGLTDI